MGCVYRAHDLELDRPVAIKVPHSEYGGLADNALDRFMREARVAAQLHHPSIVPIYDVGQSDRIPFVVYQFIEGETLAHRLKGGPLGMREAAAMLAEVAEAVGYAHSKGVVHRDIKPHNILIEAGTNRLMVADFGLAKMAGGEATITAPGVVIGTPCYMSPEQAEGRAHDTDARSDVYSLGATLYEMMTGRLLFSGANIVDVLQQVITCTPPPPRQLIPRIDRDLETICLKCLQKDPGRRYSDANELAEDLRRYLAGAPIMARPVGRAERALRFVRRHPVTAARSAVLVAATAVVVLWLAGVAGSLGELRTENKKNAARLACEANDKLWMIRRAIDRSAQDKGLIESLRRLKDRPDELRHALDIFLTETAEDYNYRFVLTEHKPVVGYKPLFNLFVLDSKGKFLADTNKDNTKWFDKDFHRRDYFVGLFKLEREAVYVSRVYRSVDRYYKIAVSRRILDGPECLAILGVNVTVGSRLIDLDMRREDLSDARLVSPMDWSYWPWRVPLPQRHDSYVVAMDHTYHDAPDADFEPAWLSPEQVPKMPLFERNPKLLYAVDRFHDGAVMNYHRVGETPLVVVFRRPYPWPFSWVLAWIPA